MEQKNYIVHPYKFNMWLFILTLIMIFGGLTSAYIVSRSFTSPDKIVHFSLPSILNFNTIIVLFSSLSMHFSVKSALKGERKKALYGLMITLVLGILFLIGQWGAFVELTNAKLPFVDERRTDNSVSFFYMFTGLHGMHIIGAIVALVFGVIKTANNSFKPGGMKVTYEVIATFWHFLGLLWVYLYLFLIYNQNYNS